jgi:preprotein translocase subunit Sec61beta
LKNILPRIRRDSGLTLCRYVILKNGRSTSAKPMSKKDNAPMPASSAGLLTFFNEETQGVKIRPEIVLIGSIALIAVSIVINIV